jgi:hypothetical protein
MLGSAEYEAINADYDRISRKHIENSYVPPPDISFAKSDALFPAGEFADEIAKLFAEQCLGPFPTWDEVQAGLEGLRELL